MGWALSPRKQTVCSCTHRHAHRVPRVSNNDCPLPLQVNEGLVVAVGPGRRTSTGDLIPPSVKEGDKVLLPEYGGSMVKLDSKE